MAFSFKANNKFCAGDLSSKETALFAPFDILFDKHSLKPFFSCLSVQAFLCLCNSFFTFFFTKQLRRSVYT